MSRGFSGSSFTIENILSSDKSSQNCSNNDQIRGDHEKMLSSQSTPDAISRKMSYSQTELDAAIDKIRSGKVGIGLIAAVYGIPISKLRYRVRKAGRDNTVSPIEPQPKHCNDHYPCPSSQAAIILDKKMRRHEYLPTLGVESCSANATVGHLMAPVHRSVTGALSLPPLCALPSTVPSVTNFVGSLGMQFGGDAAATSTSTPGVMTERHLMQANNSLSFSIQNLLLLDKSSLHHPKDDQIYDNCEKCLMLQSKPGTKKYRTTYSQADLNAAIDKARCGGVSIGYVAAVYDIPASTLHYRIRKLEAASALASIKLQPKQCRDHSPWTGSNGALKQTEKRMEFYNSSLFGFESWPAKPTYDHLMASAHDLATTVQRDEFEVPQSMQWTSAASPSTVQPVANFNIPGSSGGCIGMQFSTAASSFMPSHGITPEMLPSPSQSTMKMSDASAANFSSAFSMVSLSSKVKPLKLPLARYDPRSTTTMRMEGTQSQSPLLPKMNVWSKTSRDQASSSSQEFTSNYVVIDGYIRKRPSKYPHFDKGTMAQAFSSVREGQMSVHQFACTLFLIFVVEISAGILAYVYSDSIDVGLQENFQDTLRHNYGIQDDVTKAVDSLHRKYGCCGAVDFKDWRNSTWYNKTNFGKIDNQVQQYSNTTPQDQDRKLLKVPHICCKTMNKITCGERDHPSNIYLDGCSTVLKEEMKEHVVILGATALGISAVQIFGIFVSCALYAKLGKNDGFNDRQPFATTSSYRKRRSNM